MVERTTTETYSTAPEERYNSVCELKEMRE